MRKLWKWRRESAQPTFYNDTPTLDGHVYVLREVVPMPSFIIGPVSVRSRERYVRERHVSSSITLNGLIEVFMLMLLVIIAKFAVTWIAMEDPGMAEYSAFVQILQVGLTVVTFLLAGLTAILGSSIFLHTEYWYFVPASRNHHGQLWGYLPDTKPEKTWILGRKRRRLELLPKSKQMVDTPNVADLEKKP